MEAFLSTFSTVSVLKFWTVKVAGTWFSLSCNTDANDRDADIFSCETKSWSEIVLFLVSSRGVLPKAHSWGADSQASVQKRFSSGVAWSEVTPNWGRELVVYDHCNWEGFSFFS